MDGTFSALMSTNETYYDLDRTKCLTVKLEEMMEEIDGKAEADHNHDSAYSPLDHEHGIAAITGLLDLLLTDQSGNVKVSMQTGDILANIKAKDVGMYTYYAKGGANGCTNIPSIKESWRCLIHKTASLFGWVLAFGSNGSVYTNYLDNGIWKGWKAIYDANPSPLWAHSNGTGGYYMTAGHTVTPTKKLSECRNGWLLLWSDYDPDNSKASDYDWHCTVIPKIRPNGGKWQGHTWLCDIPTGMQGVSPYVTETRRMKWLYIYDDKITGHDANNQNGRNDCVLRAVIEW